MREVGERKHVSESGEGSEYVDKGRGMDKRDKVDL